MRLITNSELKNPWFIFSLVCFLGIAVGAYKSIETYIVSSNVSVASSDYDLYNVLKEPLIKTIQYNGTTLHGDGDNAQVFTYSFNGYMTNLPYTITLSRNAQFEDCAGCVGDWQEGMFSNPWYGDSIISLKEFVIQMVHSKGERVNGNMVWKTDGFIWKVAPTGPENKYQIEVISSSDKEWKVRA